MAAAAKPASSASSGGALEVVLLELLERDLFAHRILKRNDADGSVEVARLERIDEGEQRAAHGVDDVRHAPRHVDEEHEVDAIPAGEAADVRCLRDPVELDAHVTRGERIGDLVRKQAAELDSDLAVRLRVKRPAPDRFERRWVTLVEGFEIRLSLRDAFFRRRKQLIAELSGLFAHLFELRLQGQHGLEVDTRRHLVDFGIGELGKQRPQELAHVELCVDVHLSGVVDRALQGTSLPPRRETDHIPGQGRSKTYATSSSCILQSRPESTPRAKLPCSPKAVVLRRLARLFVRRAGPRSTEPDNRVTVVDSIAE